MRRQNLLVVSLPILAVLVGPAPCQTSGTPTQIHKEFVLGQGAVLDLARRDGIIADSAILGYVQAIEERLARAIGAKPLHVRITRGSNTYASILPSGELYISGALLERAESESELAGLLAHQLAHRSSSTNICVLASQGAPPRWADDRRESELEATRTAVRALRVVGYDPLAVLELFSKLAYEHPLWAKSIVPEDLLNLRAVLESETPPEAGYVIDSSAFVRQHERVAAALGHLECRAANIGCGLLSSRLADP
jgi:hypothetical protein